MRLCAGVYSFRGRESFALAGEALAVVTAIANVAVLDNGEDASTLVIRAATVLLALVLVYALTVVLSASAGIRMNGAIGQFGLLREPRYLVLWVFLCSEAVLFYAAVLSGFLETL